MSNSEKIIKTISNYTLKWKIIGIKYLTINIFFTKKV